MGAASSSLYKGHRYPAEIISHCVWLYHRFPFSFREVEEIMMERGVVVSYETIRGRCRKFGQTYARFFRKLFRGLRSVPWVMVTDKLASYGVAYRAGGDHCGGALVPALRAVLPRRGGLPVRAIDQFGQVIDVLVAEKRDMAVTRRFFTRAFIHGPSPAEVIIDRAAVYLRVLDEVALGAWRHTEPYVSNQTEADYGRVKSRLRPMRGLTQLSCARVISAGHAFIQNFRRGHYELGVEEPTTSRVVTAFDESGPGGDLTDRDQRSCLLWFRATQQPPAHGNHTTQPGRGPHGPPTGPVSSHSARKNSTLDDATDWFGEKMLTLGLNGNFSAEDTDLVPGVSEDFISRCFRVLGQGRRPARSGRGRAT